LINSNRQPVLNLLKTSKGQIEGIIKMIEDERYCVDVLKQVLAVEAQLKKVNLMILEQHVKSCVKQAFEAGHGDEKIEEVIELLGKYMSK